MVVAASAVSVLVILCTTTALGFVAPKPPPTGTWPIITCKVFRGRLSKDKVTTIPKIIRALYVQYYF